MHTRAIKLLHGRRVIGVACVTAAAVCGAAFPATADQSTGRTRLLDCGSAGTLTVELGPAEFLTTTTAAIHVVGSTAVLQPRQVTIVFPDGTTATTLDKAKPADVTCTYTDPAGLFVTVSGTLS
jgi:hypothetical protein